MPHPAARPSVPLIYVVDDEPLLTQLYTTLLEETGYMVSAFNNRAEGCSS